ncbi:glycine cleavage T C-terminal barrel domain-containing protein [Pacificoceanicola onchidii]|uniref:glycine cleavage T C-terminal barrel domain-containing protein n=1 Tax=Pacificoceanicola onchidii TaxID=2562685 RepID=UPI0010A5BC96|nr:glycine cleavage T C-terminal barrel domain-containing protein [Pacificoceanicola onchidii]
MAEIGPNTRLRVSPFYNATVQDGVTAFSPYNAMLMPVSYGNPDAEYDRLLNGVSQWDVSVERQVEITGPDAARLVQLLSVRDLSTIEVGKGKYIPMCDHRGVLINDPVVLKHGSHTFWLSIGDNNILMWARAIAAERGLNVAICEPDVSPMAVQGPKAEEVVAAVFGDWVRALRYFWFAPAEISGIPVIVQRSGYSKQGGFEIYLRDGSRGTELWNIVKEAGQPWGIGPGNPNPIERIESGLLSYGGDTDDQTTPFEVRLGKYVDLDLDDDVIGITALRRIKAEGVRRQQLGIVFDTSERHPGHAIWYDIEKDGQKIGHMTCGAWSPRAQAMIGFALVGAEHRVGEAVDVKRGGYRDKARLCALPFF